MGGASGDYARRPPALGRQGDYNFGQTEFGAHVDDSLRSLSASSVSSAPTKWHWPRALRMRAATGTALIVLLLLGAVSLITWMHQDRDFLAPCLENDNTSCHFECTEDDLPTLDVKPELDIVQLLANTKNHWDKDVVLPGSNARSIFLVHATCERDLTPLQACAVEAASRHHPRWVVHVLFAGPVSLQQAVKGLLAIIARANVRFSRVEILEYLWDTPYYHIAWALSLGKKSYKTTETLIRFATLYKFDGVVLDLDRVVSGPLDGLGRNFVTTEGGVTTSAAMGFEKTFRKEFSDDLAKEISREDRSACADFTGQSALRTVVDNMMGVRIDGITETLQVYSLTNGTRGPLFRPTAGPTQEDCPNVFAYTESVRHTPPTVGPPTPTPTAI